MASVIYWERESRRGVDWKSFMFSMDYVKFRSFQFASLPSLGSKRAYVLGTLYALPWISLSSLVYWALNLIDSLSLTALWDWFHAGLLISTTWCHHLMFLLLFTTFEEWGWHCITRFEFGIPRLPTGPSDTTWSTEVSLGQWGTEDRRKISGTFSLYPSFL